MNVLRNVLDSDAVQIGRVVVATAVVAAAGVLVAEGTDAVLTADAWRTALSAAIVGAASGLIATLGPWAKRPPS